MKEVHVMTLSGNTLSRAVSAYIDRCILLLRQAFQKDTNIQQAFVVWLRDEFAETASPDVLLHDSPLYTVGRYLGIPKGQIDHEVIKRAAKIARDHHW